MTNFCAAPWRGLHIQVNGNISTCCAGARSFGNINNDTIESALGHPDLKKIRKEMIENGLPDSYCKSCKELKNRNISCEMDWHNDLNKDFDIKTATDSYEFPVIFDARWNNTCNSSCIYCWSTFSSKWASILGHPDEKINLQKYEDIDTFFKKNSDRLKTVSMVGGEPLLIKQNALLVDHIPDHTTIDIITNFSVDLDNNKVFEKLLTRRKVHWHISLDNIEDRYEYVRQGSKWHNLIKNLKTLGKAIRNPPEINDHEIQFFPTYNLLNCTKLCEFQKFALDAISFFPYKFQNTEKKSIQIVWQHLNSPYELCVDNYGKDVVDLAIDEINNYSKKYYDNVERDFFEHRKTFLGTIKNTTPPQLKEKLNKFIQNKEKIFNNIGSFERLWPELSF